MKTLLKLHSVVTAHWNVLRGHVEVNGQEFRVESDGEKWVHVINEESRCETCKIVGNDVVTDGGEFVTEAWTDDDWTEFREFVFAES